MSQWRTLLIVCRELDVRLPQGNGRKQRFHHHATESEIAEATASFLAFPGLAAELSSGHAKVIASVTESPLPLRTLTSMGAGYFWPSPDDVRASLDKLAPSGSFDSIFVFWPGTDAATGVKIPCRGWGLGMGASDWSNGATYAVVSNAPSWMWQREASGEVWLHEWLHGVCEHFRNKGHVMPERDADGAEVHGYARSDSEGWSAYYRDLMSGNVLEGDARRGIPSSAWA
jgi:hypothetical protein